MEKVQKKKRTEWSPALKVGAIALAFLIIGYQIALFVHQAAVTRILANHDRRDTVYVHVPAEQAGPDAAPAAPAAAQRRAQDRAAAVVRRYAPRRVETFRFNPNTATHDELVRLGFSDRQATAIEHYRQAGGHFARKEDFRKSYVVADSVYNRLEAYIDIPKVDLNAADSAAFDALPGIGPHFAALIVARRAEIGGYTDTRQLLEIKNFGEERYEGLKDLVTVGGQ